MGELTPDRIDRETLDRIIRRAAELQTSERDIGEGLTREEVLALGKEVGIPAKYLQQAIVEAQATAGGSGERGLLASLVGPAEVGAQRVVPGNVEDVTRALVEWMESNELLVLQRRQTGRVTWEPLRGMQAAIRRGTAAFDTSKPKFMLSAAELVAAGCSPLEAGFCHVALSATLRQTRGQHLGGAAAAATLGTLAAGALTVMNAVWFVAAAPLLPAVLVVWALLRKYGPAAQRAQLGLERALDFLEHGGARPAREVPARGPGLLEVLAGEVRRAIAASTDRSRKP